jgi:hypothetical protein
MSSDIERLIAAARAAREFTHALSGGAVLTLRVPTAHELELLLAEARPQGADAAGAVRAWRRVLEQAIVGWQGVVEADLVPTAAVEPAPAVAFNAALVPLLLDALPPGGEVEIRNALLARIEARSARAEAAAKN